MHIKIKIKNLCQKQNMELFEWRSDRQTPFWNQRRFVSAVTLQPMSSHTLRSKWNTETVTLEDAAAGTGRLSSSHDKGLMLQDVLMDKTSDFPRLPLELRERGFRNIFWKIPAEKLCFSTKSRLLFLLSVGHVWSLHPQTLDMKAAHLDAE